MVANDALEAVKQESEAAAVKKAAGSKEVHYGTGRRKSSIARVFMKAGKGDVTVNGKSIEDYFPQESTRVMALKAFAEVEAANDFDLKITVQGGGVSGQAGAVSLGLARALSCFSEAFRLILRKIGLLTRDARKVERKKFGKRKARKLEQYSKR